MTSSHKPVRIIERKQREAPVANKAVPLEKTAEQIEREIVRTVKSWIDGRRKVTENVRCGWSRQWLSYFGKQSVIVGR